MSITFGDASAVDADQLQSLFASVNGIRPTIPTSYSRRSRIRIE